MTHTKQPDNNEITANFGMSEDDISMLNQVLQQVKGISGISSPSPSYEIIEQDYSA